MLVMLTCKIKLRVDVVSCLYFIIFEHEIYIRVCGSYLDE